MTLSISLLASAIAPLLVGPLSEILGRRSMLQLFNLTFPVLNAACGFSRTQTRLILLRFFAGVGGR